MKKAYHDRGVFKDKGLNVWPFGIVVDRIHFCGGNGRIFLLEFKIILVLVTFVVCRLFSRLQTLSLTHGYLTPQRKIIYTVILEYARFYVVVQCFNRNAKLRMITQNLIYRLTFLKQRTNQLCHGYHL